MERMGSVSQGARLQSLVKGDKKTPTHSSHRHDLVPDPISYSWSSWLENVLQRKHPQRHTPRVYFALQQLLRAWLRPGDWK